MTKIYCDIADLKQINLYKKKIIVKGFTTNPTLMRKAGAKDYKEYCKKLLKCLKYYRKDLSLEVLADDSSNMRRQAYEINSWDNSVYVKIPVLNSKGEFQGKLIEELNHNNINLNITAVFSVDQCKNILKKINKKTKVIISIFAGRIGDSGKNSLEIIKKCISICKKYKNVQILWASTREAFNYVMAKKIGCHIITMPPDMIKKIGSFGKTAKQLSIKTVEGFLADSKKSKFNL